MNNDRLLKHRLLLLLLLAHTHTHTAALGSFKWPACTLAQSLDHPPPARYDLVMRLFQHLRVTSVLNLSV